LKDYQLIGYQLNQVSAVTNIVGNRIFHGNAPEYYASGYSVFYPAITYSKVSGVPSVQHLVRNARYQIDCWGTSAASVRSLEEAVIGAVDQMSGTYNGFSVLASDIMLEGPMTYESDGGIYRVPIDVRIVFETSAIT
jgi:hypothetical protein